MDSKPIIITAILILGFSILISLFISANYSPAVSAYSELEECKPLLYNGEGKIDLVFFSTKEQAEKYSETLLSAHPLDENSEAFNVFYIDSYVPECKIYKDAAIFCHSAELVKKAASCPNDFIFVLKDEPSSIRSSAYLNIGSINLNHPEAVIIHEFGHLFANLAEEYVPAKLPFNSKNCVSKCSDFDGEIEGCFEGCSKSSLFRASENSVMRTLHSSHYGEFNSQLIESKISRNTKPVIAGSAIRSVSSCREKNYFLIRGNSDSGNLKITSFSLEQGCSPEVSSGDFSFETRSLSGEFNPSLIFTESQSESREQISGEVLETDNVEFTLSVPGPEGGEITIKDSAGNIAAQHNIENQQNQLCRIK